MPLLLKRSALKTDSAKSFHLYSSKNYRSKTDKHINHCFVAKDDSFSRSSVRVASSREVTPSCAERTKHVIGTTRRYLVTGSRRSSNFFLAFAIFFGGTGFLITGFLSFLSRDPSLQGENPLISLRNTSFLSTASSIAFFPQGLIMCFYGSLGLIFSIYLCSTIFWKVGSGFNEFNKESGVIRVFRWGLPGKDRRIDFSYKIKEVERLRVFLKEDINPRRSIALSLKGKGEIPLTRIGQPIPLQEIEKQASELAAFLKIEMEVEN